MQYQPTEFGEDTVPVSQVSHQKHTANANSKLIISRKILGCFGESITDHDSEVWNEKHGDNNFVVPYQFYLESFENNLEIKTRFMNAVDIFNGYCLPIRFREIIFEGTPYLNIKYDSTKHTCSTVGKQLNTENYIMIGMEDDIADILHEMMHVLGFEHEHQRPDRDLYITIRYPNFLSGRDDETVRDPDVHSYLGIPITPYDSNSIMHYPSCENSQIIRGRNTPTNKPSRLSEFDKIGVYIFYGTNNWCTRTLFGEKAYPQPHYICNQCKDPSHKYSQCSKICVKCAKTCHKSHIEKLSELQFELLTLFNTEHPTDPRSSGPLATQNDTMICSCFCTRGQIVIPMDM